MAHLDSVRRIVRASEVTEPPPPWKAVARLHFPGLAELGFDDASELLLTFSEQGRDVIDCRTGEFVARNQRVEDVSSWYGRDLLTGNGIGPLEGRPIRLCGQHGGGLLVCTADGWDAESLPIDWPDHSLLLVDPASSIYHAHPRFWKLGVEANSLAFGFSYTGRTLILATPSDVIIFGR
jgi:hypothetical protein